MISDSVPQGEQFLTPLTTLPAEIRLRFSPLQAGSSTPEIHILHTIQINLPRVPSNCRRLAHTMMRALASRQQPQPALT